MTKERDDARHPGVEPDPGRIAPGRAVPPEGRLPRAFAGFALDDALELASSAAASNAWRRTVGGRP